MVLIIDASGLLDEIPFSHQALESCRRRYQCETARPRELTRLYGLVSF